MKIETTTVVGVFGEAGARVVAHAEVVASGLGGSRYRFQPLEDFLRDCEADRAVGHATYWREILARAHMSAAVATFRSLRWCRGMIYASAQDNVLAFAACFRALVESSGDTWESLGAVPTTIARNRRTIEHALSGRAATFQLCGDLENALIHFISARKLRGGEEAPDAHRAKQAIEYVRLLDVQVPGVVRLYQSLCELTHPASESVALFLQAQEDGELRLQADPDRDKIRRICTDYAAQMTPLVQFAFQHGFVTLALLNRLPVAELRCPVMDAFRLDGISLWRRTMEAFSD